MKFNWILYTPLSKLVKHLEFLSFQIVHQILINSPSTPILSM